jgi:ribosomal protein L37AE/L43A
VDADAAAPSCAAKAEARDTRALRRSWAQLIKRIYEVDPLVCPSCGSEMKVIAPITGHDVVDAILRHLDRRD